MVGVGFRVVRDDSHGRYVRTLVFCYDVGGTIIIISSKVGSGRVGHGNVGSAKACMPTGANPGTAGDTHRSLRSLPDRLPSPKR